MINIKIGYIRVSTTDQNTARQEVLMAELGVEKVFIDRISGKNTDRPELKKMMGFVRSGDTVIVESISRFARNTKDLLELVSLWRRGDITAVEAMKRLDMKPSTFYRKVKEAGLWMKWFGFLSDLWLHWQSFLRQIWFWRQRQQENEHSCFNSCKTVYNRCFSGSRNIPHMEKQKKYRKSLATCNTK